MIDFEAQSATRRAAAFFGVHTPSSPATIRARVTRGIKQERSLKVGLDLGRTSFRARNIATTATPQFRKVVERCSSLLGLSAGALQGTQHLVFQSLGLARREAGGLLLAASLHAGPPSRHLKKCRVPFDNRAPRRHWRCPRRIGNHIGNVMLGHACYDISDDVSPENDGSQN